jgi:hypothetical protein
VKLDRPLRRRADDEHRDADARAGAAALAHLHAREGLVRQLLTEAGVEDADLAAQVTLLVDGAYAVGGSRRDPAAARQAKAAVAALLAGRVVS